MNRFLLFAFLGVCAYALNPFLPRDVIAKHELGKRDTITSSSLPCSFVITAKKITEYSDGRDWVSCDIYFARNGRTVGIYTEICNDSSSEATVVRGDLVSDGFVPYASVTVNTSSQECSCSDGGTQTVSRAEKTLDNLNPLHFGSGVLLDTGEEVIDGVTYKVEKYTFLFFDITIYIDNAGYIRIMKSGSTTTTLNYTFEGLTTDMFKLDETSFSCCQYDKRFYEAPSIEFCKRVEVPSPPCFFSVDAIKKTDSGEYVNCKLYAMNISRKGSSLVAEEIGDSYKLVVRGDVSSYNYFVGNESQCESMYDSDIVFEVDFAVYAMKTFDYAIKEETTCGNGQCTMYCENSSKTHCLTLLNSEPHYPVEYVVSSNILGKVTMTYSVPMNYSDTNVFKLDENKYPGCVAKVYKTPVSKMCEEHSFTLSELPCSYAVSGKIVKETYNGEVITCNYVLAKNTESIGMYRQVCSYESGDVKADDSYTKVVRGDLEETEYSIPFACAQYGGSTCSVNLVNQNSAKNEVDYLSDFEFVRKKSFSYDEQTKETIEGVEYDVYISDVDQVLTYYYVDKNGFIAMINKSSSYSGDSFTSFKFTFEGLTNDLFKIDSEVFSSRCNDTRLYQAPDVEFCQVFIPPMLMCSYSMNMTAKDGDDEEATRHRFYVMLNNSTGLPSVLAADDPEEDSSIIVFRFGKIESGDETCSYFSGIVNESKCKYEKTLILLPVLLFQNYLGVYYSGFQFISKEEVACDRNTCTRYCNDVTKANCITVLNSEPHYIVKYETVDSDGPSIKTYEPPVEVTDMSVFALDKEKFPGCEDHESEVYRPPKNSCVETSSSSFDYSSDSTPITPPSPPVQASFSSTSGISMVVVTLTAIVVALISFI